MTDQIPPVTGIARRKRSDAGVLRKSSLDTFCDQFRRMSKSEQATALEVLRQIQRLGAPISETRQESNMPQKVQLT